MVLTPSTMALPLGAPLPAFALADLDGRLVSSADYAGRPLLVAFICGHCPYVTHIRAGFAAFCAEYLRKGLSIVAINSNDVAAFPEDGPAGMRQEAASAGYAFPYLFDETQEVAKSFRAACTPDLFVFDRTGALAYRGQFDDSHDSRPRTAKPLPVTGRDLRAAADAVLAGQPVPSAQKSSIGCNIKWKRGNAPDYF
jgi:peroxiredoxin